MRDIADLTPPPVHLERFGRRVLVTLGSPAHRLVMEARNAAEMDYLIESAAKRDRARLCTVCATCNHVVATRVSSLTPPGAPKLTPRALPMPDAFDPPLPPPALAVDDASNRSAGAVTTPSAALLLL